MTDIREAAAKAARDWLTVMLQRHDQTKVIYNGYSYGEGYLSGHAAGYADGARAFAEYMGVTGSLTRFLAAAPGTEEVKPNNNLVARLCYLCEAQFDADPGDARVLCEKCEEETGCRR